MGAFTGDSEEEIAELTGIPDPQLPLLRRAELGSVGQGRHVAQDRALALGVGEGLVENAVDVADRLD